MTKTEAIIWKRIEEKAHRMATQYNETPIERETACWDAHCYKYIDSYGKVRYILTQTEFDKLKWAAALKDTASEALYCCSHKLDAKSKAILEYALTPNFPSFEILHNLSVISPMWDDRNKKSP